MKKNLFVLGLAVAAFASCTSEDVVDMPQQGVIEFNQFVNNNTRAVTEVTTATLNNYFVFGEYGNADGSYGTKLFDNELQSTVYHWVKASHYSFGAYADGNGGQITKGVSYDAASYQLSFLGYTPDDKKDLVAAVAKTSTPAELTQAPQAVPLNFKHMLSQVKFTFYTNEGETNTLAISNLKFKAVKMADGTYTNGVVKWLPKTYPMAEYTYASIKDIAIPRTDPTVPERVSSETHLVIPQAGTDTIVVTFDATITGPGLTTATKTLTAKLPCPKGQNSSLQDNVWLPGYRYNYVAEVQSNQIIGGFPITFTATVEDWQDAYQPETPTNPQIPTPIK